MAAVLQLHHSDEGLEGRWRHAARQLKRQEDEPPLTQGHLPNRAPELQRRTLNPLTDEQKLTCAQPRS